MSLTLKRLKHSPERELLILFVLIVLSVAIQIGTGFTPTFRFRTELIPKAIIATFLILGVRVVVPLVLELFFPREKKQSYTNEEILTLSTGGELLLRGSILGGVSLFSPALGQLINFIANMFIEGGIRRSWVDGLTGGAAGIVLGALYLQYRSLFLVTVTSFLALLILRLYQGSPFESRFRTWAQKTASQTLKRFRRGRNGRNTL